MESTPSCLDWCILRDPRDFIGEFLTLATTNRSALQMWGAMRDYEISRTARRKSIRVQHVMDHVAFYAAQAPVAISAAEYLRVKLLSAPQGVRNKIIAFDFSGELLWARTPAPRAPADDLVASAA